MARYICFASDYGYADDFAGVCRGVIARTAPGIRVIDVTHGLPRCDVLAGAVIVRNTLPYLPEAAVHLAVVDPGVGGLRRAVALRSGGGRLFVGPDNGLLVPAAERDGGVAEVRELTSEALWLTPVSATFHGRDVFAPVAARLAAGLALAQVGRAIDPSELVRVDIPEPLRHRDGVTGTVLFADHFGNLTLNLCAGDLEVAGLGGEVELERDGVRHRARLAGTFSAVPAGDLVVLIDGYGQAAVAVNTGSAAEVLGLSAGDEVRLRPVPPQRPTG